MKQRPSREGNCYWAGQETPRLFWNRTACCWTLSWVRWI